MNVNQRPAQLVVSIAAVVLLGLHLLVPQLKVDAISVTLLVLALIPWLVPLVSSAKLPGGWEVTFRDVADAGAKIRPAATPEPLILAEAASLELASDPDANLALVRVRIAIEDRLRELAGKHEAAKFRSPHKIVRELSAKGILSGDAASGLAELIHAGNRAAHGAAIEPSVANWARREAPRILSELDALLARRNDDT